MLLKTNINKDSDVVKSLRPRLEEFIRYKRPYHATWAENQLHRWGISRKGLEWKDRPYEDRSSSTTIEAENNEGEKEQLTAYSTYTLQDRYGKFRYKTDGIPAKVGDYVKDIASREFTPSVKTFTKTPKYKSFLEKFLYDSVVCDEDMRKHKKKILEDLLVKGNSYIKIEAHNQIRKIKKWKRKKSTDDEKDFIHDWKGDDKSDEIAYRKGVYIDVIDPELVFTEPGVCDPTEYFIAQPYSYGELILEYPELEEHVSKEKLGTNSKNPFEKLREKKTDINKIEPEQPFPYKLADNIRRVYMNDQQPGDGVDLSAGWDGVGNNWYDEAMCSTDTDSGYSRSASYDYYKKLTDDKTYWVWKYYNKAYNPLDCNSGDYCAIFIGDVELYSGPIMEADKEEPLIHLKLHETDSYLSHSMVDELKETQNQINWYENMKRVQIELLSSVNYATSEEFITGGLVVNPFDVNVHLIKTEKQSQDLSNQIQQMNISQILQPLPLGNPNAVNLGESQVQMLLREMDQLYPTVPSKLAYQGEQAQEMTSYSPVLVIDDLIETLGEGVSRASEKLIKETAHSFKYFFGTNTVIPYLGYAVMVVEDEEKRLIQLAENIRIRELPKIRKQAEQQQLLQQQQQQQSREQQLGPELGPQLNQLSQGQALSVASEDIQIDPIFQEEIKNKTKAKELLSKVQVQEDEMIYFVYDTLAVMGRQGIEVTVTFNKTKEERIRDTMGFVDSMRKAGAMVSTQHVAELLANIYGVSMDLLPLEPPSDKEQFLITTGQARLQIFAYLSDEQAEQVGSMYLKLPQGDGFQPTDYTTAKQIHLDNLKHDASRDVARIKEGFDRQYPGGWPRTNTVQGSGTVTDIQEANPADNRSAAIQDRDIASYRAGNEAESTINFDNQQQ